MTSKVTFASDSKQLSHLFKDHPAWMVIREAVQNMIDAVLNFIKNNPDQSVDLKIRKLDIAKGLLEFDSDGSTITYFKDKLSFLNPGGMSAKELSENFSQIGCSGDGKFNSIDGNYGQGIKTAVLYWSDLLCITYKDKKAHYIWLGKEDIPNSNDFDIVVLSEGDGSKVQDCTDWVVQNAVNREYNLEEDFTEVIIMGKDSNPTQDTYRYPFDPNKKMPALWIRRELASRFWKLPKMINLLLHTSVLKDSFSKTESKYIEFKTFDECFNYVAPKATYKPQKEVVLVKNPEGHHYGAKIHFYYDPKIGEDYENNQWAPHSTHKSNIHGGGNINVSSIIFKDEMFDVKNEQRLEMSFLLKLGIYQDHGCFKICYELPSSTRYCNDMYRTKVLLGQQEILLTDEDILLDIVNNMPDWFETLVKDTKVKSLDLNDRIMKRFNDRKSFNDLLKGLTENGGAGMIGQSKGETRNKSIDREPNQRRPRIINQTGNKNGMPIPPKVISDFESTIEPYFARIEGTGANPVVLINRDWKKIEKMASALSFNYESEQGQWFLRAKDLLIEEFTLSTIDWYFVARSENLQGRLTTDEYQDAIIDKSINMHLITSQPNIFNMVKSELKSEFKLECNEIKKSNPLNEMFVDVTADNDNLVINKREFDASKGLPVTTNYKGEVIS